MEAVLQLLDGGETEQMLFISYRGGVSYPQQNI